MGGDLAPQATLQGALDALEKSINKNLKIILLGDETAIRTEIAGREMETIEIVHTDEVVNMEDKGPKVLKMKPNLTSGLY